MTFDERFDTTASPEQAFPFLSDFKNLPAWDPSVTAVEQLIPGAVGLGTKFAVRLKVLGIEAKLDYHVESYEADRRAVLIGTGGAATATDTIVVTPRGNGSRVQWKAEIHLWGPLQILDPIAAMVFGPNVRAATARLKDSLDALAAA